MTIDLPQPNDDALALSRVLRERIAKEVGAAGGWLGFERYMQLALYEPGLGYYSGGSTKFGPAGDFVTAPELSHLFGNALADQLAQLLEQLKEPVILELGAGTGALAADILRSLDKTRVSPQYWIIELSADLKRRQQRRLNSYSERVRWLSRLPDELFQGVILANEVADALPVSCFVKRAGAVLPLGVRLVNGELAWGEGPVDLGLSEAVQLLEACLGRTLPEGYRSEIRLELPGWIQTLNAMMIRGAILIVDYGLVRSEYYHPDRNQGTLLCHYRHRAHANPFLFPGLQDIGAWVDFSAVADAATGAGAQVSGFTTQAQFLLESEAVKRLSGPSSDQLRGLKTLVLPGEMGECFKLILLSRGMKQAGLDGRDFRDRL